MPAPPRPPPPEQGKVTHFSIELSWDEALSEANETLALSGDGRVKVSVQEQDKHGQWGHIHTGFGKGHVVVGLESLTQYRYRIRFQNDDGASEWSPMLAVSTTKEPMTGIHLHRAVALNDVEGVQRIMETGEVHVEVTDKYGFTPLMQAAQKGYTDIIETLISYGAEVNAQNDAGKTPLMLAAFAGKLQAVQCLREHNASYAIHDKGGSFPLHWAVDGQNLELIDWMISDGANVEVKDILSKWTPLLRSAALNGNRDVAQRLIKNGARIDVVDADGKTPLMIAVLNDHQKLVELLLQNKADANVRNSYGKTAFEMATSMDKRRVGKLLQEYMQKNTPKNCKGKA